MCRVQSCKISHRNADHIAVILYIAILFEYTEPTFRPGTSLDAPVHNQLISKANFSRAASWTPFSRSADWYRQLMTRPGSGETISSAKCREYAEAIWGTFEVMMPGGLRPRVVRIRNRGCGTANPLVAGGSDARPGVHGHVAAVGEHADNGDFVLHCGGTLIAPTWVLSAAHCTHGPNGRPTVVRLGVCDLRDRGTGVTAAVKRYMRHPAYKPPAMYADLALLELQEAVAFSAHVTPACLYQRYESAPPKAWIVGWGASEHGGKMSNRLRQARIDILDNLSCAMHYRTSAAIPRGISPSMICAGDYKDGWKRDTCAGDSGGPLQVSGTKESCLFEVVGVTSFGEDCASERSFGVYTRVSHYLDWIESVVWPGQT